MMRFRVGLMIGFAAGYYLGTKAGRERYNQIQQWVRKAKQSDLVGRAEEKVKDLVHHDTERVSGVGEVQTATYSPSR